MTKSDHRKPKTSLACTSLTSMAKTIEPVRSSHKSVMANRLVEYARSVKGKDVQGRASQAQARSTGVKMHRAFHFGLGGHLGAEPLRARSMKRRQQHASDLKV